MRLTTTGNYNIEGIGIVYVLLKTNAKTVRARWKGGRIHVTAPTGIDYENLISIVKEFAPKMDQCKPKPLYNIDDCIEFDNCKINIVRQNIMPNRILLNGKDDVYTISIGQNWNMESPDTMRNISKLVCRVAQIKAFDILIPLAHEVAARIGKQPLRWEISNGHRVLGHCNTRGVIALSYILSLYPQQLREYVICHELAHLSEMNHSERFHAICDAYCNGQEKRLVAQLKAFRPPVIR